MTMLLLAACLYKAAQGPTFLRLAPLCRFPACSAARVRNALSIRRLSGVNSCPFAGGPKPAAGTRYFSLHGQGFCSKRVEGRVFKSFDFMPKTGGESQAMA